MGAAVTIIAIRIQRGAGRWGAGVLCVALVGLVALAGCGSSKPAYCSALTNLEHSIKGLTSLNLSSGVSGLESQLKKIQTDANALAKSVKSEFASETSAVKSSIASLETAVKTLASSPSAGQVATVKSAASSVVNSVKSFADAASPKCG
jgi:hypothetical protein